MVDEGRLTDTGRRPLAFARRPYHPVISEARLGPRQRDDRIDRRLD